MPAVSEFGFYSVARLARLGGGVTKRELEAEELQLKFFGGSRYLGAYLGPREELEVWVRPQVCGMDPWGMNPR